MTGRTALRLRNLLGGNARIATATCKRPPHTFRILFVGDSYTYGFGVAARQSLPAHLETVLNERCSSPFFEVINVGVPGLNLYSEWALLRQVSASVEFDLLIVCLSRDDWNPWDKHELVESTQDCHQRWDGRLLPTPSTMPAFDSALAAIAEEQRSAGHIVALIYFGVHRSREGLDYVRALSEKLGVPFVDLITPFERFDTRHLHVSPVDAHPSELANRIGAVEAARGLAALLPARSNKTDLEVTAEWIERLSAYVEMLMKNPSEFDLVFRHIAEYLTCGPGVTEEVRARAEEFRHICNRCCAILLSFAVLPKIRPDIGELNGSLFKLERFLILSELGFPELTNTRCSAVALDELFELASQCRTMLIAYADPSISISGSARGTWKANILSVGCSSGPANDYRPGVRK
ncbi:MAG TPA: SGNH/GDSL hydrolase family protein [Blastocatellia bacterium]